MEYSYNATAYDIRGRSIPEPWGDQDQYGDFNAKSEDDEDALQEARDWARATFAREPRAVTVSIIQHVREDGAARSRGWRYHRSVETLER